MEGNSLVELFLVDIQDVVVANDVDIVPLHPEGVAAEEDVAPAAEEAVVVGQVVVCSGGEKN